jgi:hypothetical protein
MIDGWIDCDIKLAKVRNGLIFTGQKYSTFDAEIHTFKYFTIAHISEKLIRSMNFSQFCNCFRTNNICGRKIKTRPILDIS